MLGNSMCGLLVVDYPQLVKHFHYRFLTQATDRVVGGKCMVGVSTWRIDSSACRLQPEDVRHGEAGESE